MSDQSENDPFKDAESIRELPDFNSTVLDGKTPEQVFDEFGVHVEVLGLWDPQLKATPIIVAGTSEGVRHYLRTLRSTWPSVI